MYLQSLKLQRPMVKEIHYPENTLFDLDPKVKGVKVTQGHQYPQHHVTYAPALFDLDLGDLDPKINVTQNVA